MSGQTILIVDDEPFNVDYLEQELQDQGFQTLSAGNGLTALEVVQAEQPDLVLLDIMMPGMDGFEVLTRLKADPQQRHIPVVVISAMSDIDNVVRGIELGAEDYLPKPFDETLLHARIGSALEKKRLRDIEQAHLHNLEKELEIGHRIQIDFLPTDLPVLTGWDLDACFRPAREVAGDFYDAFLLPDGKLVFLLGDVADKGVGAALYMALYRSLLRASLNNGMLLDDPAGKLIRAVRHTNDYVCQTHEGALFATLFAAILEPETGQLIYLNAGHNPPLYLNSNRTELVHPSGPALGILAEQEYWTRELHLEPGDRLFIYSDGLEDAKDQQGGLFGQERLFAAMAGNGVTASEIISAVDQFSGEADQFDDLTLVCLKRL